MRPALPVAQKMGKNMEQRDLLQPPLPKGKG
jgi:hypothetical protein